MRKAKVNYKLDSDTHRLVQGREMSHDKSLCPKMPGQVAAWVDRMLQEEAQRQYEREMRMLEHDVAEVRRHIAEAKLGEEMKGARP